MTVVFEEVSLKTGTDPVTRDLVYSTVSFYDDSLLRSFVLIYFQRDATLHSLFISGKLLYMFRVVSSPIIRSTYDCIYSIWYLLTVRDKNKLKVICIYGYKTTINFLSILPNTKLQLTDTTSPECNH